MFPFGINFMWAAGAWLNLEALVPTICKRVEVAGII